MGRVTIAAAATLTTVALAAAAPAVAAAVPAASAQPAVAEERDYTVTGYSALFPLDLGTFHILPAQGTWFLTIRFDVFNLALFQGTYTTDGNVSSFTDTELELPSPSCNFTLVTGPSAIRYAGVGSCKVSSSPFPLTGLVLLKER
jgi:hypothetical protein